MWKKIILFFITLLFAFIMFMGYLLSDKDYKEKENFCKQYIPLLELYYKVNNHYPERLSDLDEVILSTQSLNKACGYNRENLGYHFILFRGMGVAGYDSIKKEWWYD